MITFHLPYFALPMHAHVLYFNRLTYYPLAAQPLLKKQIL